MPDVPVQHDKQPSRLLELHRIDAGQHGRAKSIGLCMYFAI